QQGRHRARTARHGGIPQVAVGAIRLQVAANVVAEKLGQIIGDGNAGHGGTSCAGWERNARMYGKPSGLATAGLDLATAAAGAGIVAPRLQSSLPGLTRQVVPAPVLPQEIGMLFQVLPVALGAMDGAKMDGAPVTGLTGGIQLKRHPAGRARQVEVAGPGGGMPGGEQIIREAKAKRAVAGAHQRLRRRGQKAKVKGLAAIPVAGAAAAGAGLRRAPHGNPRPRRRARVRLAKACSLIRAAATISNTWGAPAKRRRSTETPAASRRPAESSTSSRRGSSSAVSR